MKQSVKTRLQDMLKSSGTTENELAKLAGVEYTTLHRIVSGETAKPSRNTLIPIAKALNVSVEYLMTGQSAETELTLLQRALDKLEEQIDRKDAMIEKLMNKLISSPNFLQALNVSGLHSKRRHLSATA